jgi:hypothetical protein
MQTVHWMTAVVPYGCPGESFKSVLSQLLLPQMMSAVRYHTQLALMAAYVSGR